MHGTFEQNNSYPFVSAPLGGWGCPDPSGVCVIKNISSEKFVKLEGDAYTYVDTDTAATSFKNFIRAVTAADDLLTGIKASQAREQAEPALA